MLKSQDATQALHAVRGDLLPAVPAWAKLWPASVAEAHRGPGRELPRVLAPSTQGLPGKEAAEVETWT